MSTLSTNRSTLAGLRSTVYDLCDEEPNAVFPYATVDRLINAGVGIVGAVVGYPYTVATTTAQPELADYPLIDARLRIDGKPDIASVTLDGVAARYTVAWDVLTLSEPPTVAQTLEVTYKKDRDPLVQDTDALTLSAEAAHAVAVYTAYLLKLRDDELAVAERWKDEYDRLISGLKTIRTGVYKPTQAR